MADEPREKNMRKVLLIIGLLVAFSGVYAQKKMLHVLSDDKLMHYGGFIGVNMPSYLIQPENIYSPSVGGGVSIGGYVDLRMCKYLNLRFCPSYNANFITVQAIRPDTIHNTQTMVMPISLPLYIKWSAKRKWNYCPYVLGGGGVSFDISAKSKANKNILTKNFDYFAVVGLGCDFYNKWFRCSPEIKYQFGFNNLLAEDNKDGTWGKDGWSPHNEKYYMQTLKELGYHQISIVFNFGSL